LIKIAPKHDGLEICQSEVKTDEGIQCLNHLSEDG